MAATTVTVPLYLQAYATECGCQDGAKSEKYRMILALHNQMSADALLEVLAAPFREHHLRAQVFWCFTYCSERVMRDLVAVEGERFAIDAFRHHLKKLSKSGALKYVTKEYKRIEYYESGLCDNTLMVLNPDAVAERNVRLTAVLQREVDADLV